MANPLERLVTLDSEMAPEQEYAIVRMQMGMYVCIYVCMHVHVRMYIFMLYARCMCWIYVHMYRSLHIVCSLCLCVRVCVQ